MKKIVILGIGASMFFLGSTCRNEYIETDGE